MSFDFAIESVARVQREIKRNKPDSWYKSTEYGGGLVLISGCTLVLGRDPTDAPVRRVAEFLAEGHSPDHVVALTPCPVPPVPQY
eukprot:834743-Rhodomonas_salina.1